MPDMAVCAVLQTQGFLPKLLIEIRQAFPSAMLYTPADHGARNASDWPSMADLVTAGKRVMVVSGADYGADAAGVLFTRPQICNWQVELGFPAIRLPNSCWPVFPWAPPLAWASVYRGALWCRVLALTCCWLLPTPIASAFSRLLQLLLLPAAAHGSTCVSINLKLLAYFSSTWPTYLFCSPLCTGSISSMRSIHQPN